MTTTSSLPARKHREADSMIDAVNNWTVDSGREYVAIEHLERLEPFFLNIVGAGNQWLYCGSNGALTAGRESAESALFPYYTVDKIIDNWNTTGPWTAIVTNEKLWNPFRPSIALLTPTHRRIMKSLLGDAVVFDELHLDLNLRLTYRWQFSHKYGFVRNVRLTNESSVPRSMRLVDGLDNLLPAGVDSRMQLQYSCLADAYKVSELECEGSLLIHRLAAGITDEPVPLESLKATTVWTTGLGSGPTFMTRRDSEEFLRGRSPVAEGSIRAKRGAMFLARELTLEPGESVEWMMVAEINQTQTDVSALRRALADPETLKDAVEADVQHGRERLADLVGSADGFQQTADRDVSLYHYHNTLSNIMRGGVPNDGYNLRRNPFIKYLATHNRQVAAKHDTWLRDLPDRIRRDELLTRIGVLGDPDLKRLADEYLPLILSRRHGDPSRPWNRFFIRMPDESGNEMHHFEGNWRDIFQNWEALAWSYPEYTDGFVSKFLNASTVDGFNPYRITSSGVECEIPDEDDPWASIGYWGDHQIVYLLKLLELESRVHPDRLTKRLDSPDCVFVDVPYRLKSWEETLEDPRDTVEFDRERHDCLMALKEKIGGDGLLLRHADGEPVRVTMAEKLLIPALVKLGNLVPGGGIWMNTQRPEWNDANNALAGCGLSVVTACYLYRYLGLLQGMIGNHPGDELRITPSTAGLLEAMNELLDDSRWQRQGKLTGSERFRLVEVSGRAIERHRQQVYGEGPGTPAPFRKDIVLEVLEKARTALEGTLRQNRRSDSLWHSYNILVISRAESSLDIERLPVMLEGQVAILSSGILEPGESLELLEALPSSQLWTERHQTYLLYPDGTLPAFLENNRVPADKANRIPTLERMGEAGDRRLLVVDPDCGFRFQSELTNGYALKAVLDQLADDPDYADTLAEDRSRIEALYESTFRHRSFTGRSGTMFGYEGLGCVYWHMVSKLMLAAQEVAIDATQDACKDRLIESYYAIQHGLGFRQRPESYGAFPAEPYSHSPAHSGAKQPGLTGQVKEGILCRLGELGVDFRDGCLSFQPKLLRKAEFSGLPKGPQHDELPRGTIRFTFAQTPVSYHIREDIGSPHGTVHFIDGSRIEAAKGVLDPETTSELTRQTGKITGIDIEIPSQWLIS